MKIAASSRARNKIRAWFSRETRADTEQKGRDALEQALKQQNLPHKKLAGSAVLAQVIREAGFKKAEDFYLALGSGKVAPTQIVNKVIQRLKTEEVAEEETIPLKPAKAKRTISSGQVGVNVQGDRRRARAARKVLHAGARRRDRRLHLARQGNHDPSRRLPERQGAQAEPRAVHARELGGRGGAARLPRPDRSPVVGSAAPAGGRGADLRRARREHRQLRRRRRRSAREELVHGRARRREGSARAA